MSFRELFKEALLHIMVNGEESIECRKFFTLLNSTVRHFLFAYLKLWYSTRSGMRTEANVLESRANKTLKLRYISYVMDTNFSIEFISKN